MPEREMLVRGGRRRRGCFRRGDDGGVGAGGVGAGDGGSGSGDAGDSGAGGSDASADNQPAPGPGERQHGPGLCVAGAMRALRSYWDSTSGSLP